jgi:hypothetical protein
MQEYAFALINNYDYPQQNEYLIIFAPDLRLQYHCCGIALKGNLVKDQSCSRNCTL